MSLAAARMRRLFRIYKLHTLFTLTGFFLVSLLLFLKIKILRDIFSIFSYKSALTQSTPLSLIVVVDLFVAKAAMSQYRQHEINNLFALVANRLELS